MSTDTIVHPDYMRGQGFFDPAKNTDASCTFVGVGGIGSFASFAVAKLGIPKITLIDPDHVEPHNLPSQMFDTTQAFDSKVDAAHNNIHLLNPDCCIESVAARITDEGWKWDDDPDYAMDEFRLSGIVVSGLDSMTARHDLWHQALKLNVRCPLYIDARLDGQLMVLYALRPWDLTDIEQYEATLLSDDEVEAGLCTERAIIDVGFTVAAQIARMVRLHLAEKPVDNITVINQATNTITKGEWYPL